jgi:hypothetical protein
MGGTAGADHHRQAEASRPASGTRHRDRHHPGLAGIRVARGHRASAITGAGVRSVAWYGAEDRGTRAGERLFSAGFTELAGTFEGYRGDSLAALRWHDDELDRP